ncbi:carbohydrate sulfotransferase 1 isoform X2 [Brachyhypopomus gauderio]|uniref:carbohydrate sulfotransferase 1 isoform X2 n=1 Tax=Brachyhypopomus gauderio TaxID=698409 RepID=UPI004042F872
MEFSWKIVILLTSVSLGVQYIVVRPLLMVPKPCPRHTLYKESPGNAHTQMSFCKNSSVHTEAQIAAPQKHILLFSQTRTGSSFTGQLFNQHPEIFYMFEPLYHIQKIFSDGSSPKQQARDRALLGAYRDLLLNLYTCDLSFLEDYIQPEPKNHMTASFFRRSSSHALCSPPVCLGASEKEDRPEEVWCNRKCRTLNLTLASLACQSRSHVAIKTVRFPLVKDLRTLIEDPRLDLKIVHLVRDPRAVLASRMATFSDQYRSWKIWNATNHQPRHMDLSLINKMCKDMDHSVLTGLQNPDWLRGRYLLLRYEDLALNPEDKTKEIYKFLGLDLDPRVLTWIAQNTNSTNKWNYKFSTSRDSRTTLQRWRLQLSFDIVRSMQSLCSTSFALLGYRKVQSMAELRNTTLSLVEPIEF